MLEILNSKNGMKIYSVYDDVFSDYGRVIENIDVSKLITVAEKITFPEAGTVYVPSLAALEDLSVKDKIQNELYGELPVQIGYCSGYNSVLNATEWHTASELNVAVTPFVLILGLRSQIKDGRINSADMKAFFIPQGVTVEIYATSLHYCPCQVSDSGFNSLVVLPSGTNTRLENMYDNGLLFAKNKWLLAHDENKDLIAKGAVSGIYGENYRINY